jgi:hypothetical protein
MIKRTKSNRIILLPPRRKILSEACGKVNEIIGGGSHAPGKLFSTGRSFVPNELGPKTLAGRNRLGYNDLRLQKSYLGNVNMKHKRLAILAVLGSLCMPRIGAAQNSPNPPKVDWNGVASINNTAEGPIVGFKFHTNADGSKVSQVVSVDPETVLRDFEAIVNRVGDHKKDVMNGFDDSNTALPGLVKKMTEYVAAMQAAQTGLQTLPQYVNVGKFNDD